jgi:hypothetical protein
MAVGGSPTGEVAFKPEAHKKKAGFHGSSLVYRGVHIEVGFRADPIVEDLANRGDQVGRGWLRRCIGSSFSPICG